MIPHGSLAVAIVQRQIMVVQAAHSHSSRDRWVDVNTFIPFGERVFLASSVPQARIPSSDILTIFPRDDCIPRVSTKGILELSHEAFLQFIDFSARRQQRYDELFDAWSNSAA
ncbi:hypothetical protein BKA93DRAFT_623815 [Sparassis latifolia]|uniref:Uncharacterized protein n=1 Tax=Sparassis crispa TaxID=139825 RepID=A0A401GWC8_9APHY|nr:hypothetical protein SCP_0903480 [Sparassis crispa]GBE86469.1 hypothetical protein SCP_0903480 [Sparassis crispa]